MVGQPQARIVAMLLLTLWGTPFLFAGDEIGMESVAVPPAERVRDPFEKLVGGYGLNRDPERSPMRWDASEAGGFTTGEPWLPMGDVSICNVGQQRAEPRSLLWLYHRLIEIRRREPALTEGTIRPMRSRNDVFGFRRVLDDGEILVALNLVHEPAEMGVGGDRDAAPVELISTGRNSGSKARRSCVPMKG